MTFAGIPGIMIGYNEDVAWSATVAYWDLTDVYIEELTEDGQGVVFRGEDVPFIKKKYSFQTPSGSQEEDFLWVPHHGPVLSIDEDAGVAISMKSILQESTTDLQFFVNVGRVGSMEDAKQHFALSQASAFSFTLIDDEGNIAFFPFAELPRREWDTSQVPARTPFPGNGDYEWGEENIDYDELPKLLNPPNGFIATANAGITDGMLDGIPGNAGYPPLQTVVGAPGIRQARIVDMIAEGQDAHLKDSHAAIQADYFSLLGQILTPTMLEAVEDESLGTEAASCETYWTSGTTHAQPAFRDRTPSPRRARTRSPRHPAARPSTSRWRSSPIKSPATRSPSRAARTARPASSKRFQLAGGQIHRRDSPNYDDLLQKWLAHEYVVMPFTSEQVDDGAVEFVEVVGEP